MCTRYPIINRVSELKVHIELTRFVQPEKIEIDANERAVNEKSQYCFFVCTTFDSFLNDLSLTFYHILSQNSILRLPKSSLPTALSAHIYTLSFNTIFSAHAFILFINPTHFIRSCIFSCSVTPCFSSICFTKVSTCSLAS